MVTEGLIYKMMMGAGRENVASFSTRSRKCDKILINVQTRKTAMQPYVVSHNDQFVSRAIKLAALREGYNVVPDNWFDCVLYFSDNYVGVLLNEGVTVDSISKKLHSSQGEPSFFRNFSGDSVVGVSYNGRDENGEPSFNGCDIFGQVVFVAQVQIGYQPPRIN